MRRGDELLGWVGVGRPLSSVVEGVRAARWRLVWSAGAIALVMIAAGWWIAMRLTHSLERLTAYAREVRDGRPAAPVRSRATEIAELSRAFEEMRDTLEGRQHVAVAAVVHDQQEAVHGVRCG